MIVQIIDCKLEFIVIQKIQVEVFGSAVNIVIPKNTDCWKNTHQEIIKEVQNLHF